MTTKILLFFLFLSSYASAQDSIPWVRYEQFGIGYTLPQSWWVDGFGNYEPRGWDSYGSGVCNCTGTMNGNDSLGIKMVIYPSNTAGLDSLKRYRVEDYEWQDAQAQEMLPTQSFSLKWTQRSSHWTNDPKQQEVWQFKSQTDYNTHLLVYFWAMPDVLEKQRTTIFKILHSIKPFISLVPYPKGKKWGYIRQSSLAEINKNFVIPPIYDYAEDFSTGFEGMAKVARKHYFGIIDRYGKELIPLDYNNITKEEELWDSDFVGRFVIYKSLNKKLLMGVYEIGKGEIVPCVYSDYQWIYPETELLQVSKDGLWGIYSIPLRREIVSCLHFTPEEAKQELD